jgi:hypothetical protein
VDVLLHELAHALTPGHGHDDVWKNVAQALGCSGHRCCPAFVEPSYLGFCACDGNVVSRHRLTLRRPVCRKCKRCFVFSFSSSPFSHLKASNTLTTGRPSQYEDVQYYHHA